MYRYRMRGAGSALVLVGLVMVGVVIFGLIVNALLGPGEPDASQVGASGEPQATQGVYAGQEPSAAITLSRAGEEGEASLGGVSMDVARTQAPAAQETEGAIPRILIYQTHSQEAYTMAQDAQYVEAGKWRTADNFNNVVRVGGTLAYFLQNQYGWGVYHDTTDYETPKLSTAYERSLAGMERDIAAMPSLDVMIDVHRDAWNANNVPKAIEVDGKPTARIYFVVGKGTSYSTRTDWQTNLALAQMVCDKLNQIHPDLCRGVTVKDNRYNQHMGDKALLVEMGHNENTLEEVLNSVPYLAQALNDVFEEIGMKR